MKRIVSGILGLVVAACIAGCAGQTEQLSMQSPQQGPNRKRRSRSPSPMGRPSAGPQAARPASWRRSSSTPTTTTCGITSSSRARKAKTCKPRNKPCTMIEQLSNQQGTGQITLFFPTGSAELRQGSEQGRAAHPLPRLYLAREPGPRGALRVDRQRLRHREHADQ